MDCKLDIILSSINFLSKHLDKRKLNKEIPRSVTFNFFYTRLMVDEQCCTNGCPVVGDHNLPFYVFQFCASFDNINLSSEDVLKAQDLLTNFPMNF